jgi:hypothetical protein
MLAWSRLVLAAHIENVGVHQETCKCATSLSMNEGNKIIMVVHDAYATRDNLAENFERHDNVIEVEGLKLYSRIAGGAAVCNDVDLKCKATRFVDHARIGTAGALKPLIKLMYSEDTHYK